MKLLKNIDVKLISILEYPQKPANKKPLVFKDSTNSLEIQTTIEKFSKTEGLLYVTVMSANEADTDNEMATSDEIKKACHSFMKSGTLNRIDKDHNLIPNESVAVVESYIDENGSWKACLDISSDKELCEKAETGKLTGVSIYGSCEKEEVVKDDNGFTASILKSSMAVHEKLMALIDKVGFMKKSNEEEEDMNEKDLADILEKKYGLKPTGEEEEGSRTEAPDMSNYVEKAKYDELVKDVEKLKKARSTQENDTEKVSYEDLINDPERLEKFMKENPKKYELLKSEYIAKEL